MSGDLPLVSVIVPCYNHEKYVEICIDSIFRQTYKNIEVIVVDDCSKDSSVEVIKRLKHKYDFKFIEHDENVGVVKSLNSAIRLCSGSYVVLLASDDVLMDDSIECRLDFLIKNSSYLAVFADAEGIDENGATRYPSIIEDYYKVKHKGLICQDSLTRNLILNWCIPGPVFMCRREAYNNDNFGVGEYNESYFFEDRDFYLRLIAQNKLIFYPKIVSKYRLLESSLKFSPRLNNELILIERNNLKYFNGINKLLLWISIQKIHFKVFCYTHFRGRIFNKLVNLYSLRNK